jgi:hypothetical protein
MLFPENIKKLSMPLSTAERIIMALPSINAPNAVNGTGYIAAAATGIVPTASIIKPESGCKRNWIANCPGIIS